MESHREKYFQSLIDELMEETSSDPNEIFRREHEGNKVYQAFRKFSMPFDHMEMQLRTATDSHQNTALHYAAADGNPRNMARVLRPMNSPPINAVNSDGYTALQLALMKMNEVNNLDREKLQESVRLLLEAGADPMLPNARENGIVSAAMLYCPVTINRLYCSIVQREPSKITLMQLFKNADWTLLHFMWSRDVELTKQFIDSDRSILRRYKGRNFALHLAVEARAPAAFFELFVAYDLDPNYRHPGTNETPLHRVCELADEWLNLDVVEKLLELGANPNLTNRWGQNCLHLAAKAGCDLVVRLLLKYNVETDTDDLAGKNAMHHAAVGGSKEVIIATLHGTGLSALDKCRSDRRESALHLASYHCHAEAVAYLIRLGLNPNELDCKGMTPMHYALMNEDINLLRRRTVTVDILVLYGAKMTDPLKYCLKRSKLLSNASILIRHFALKPPLNPKLTAHFMSEIMKDGKLKEVFDNCLVELQAMKKYEVFGWVSMHTILTAPLNVIKPLMRNSDVVRAMYRCIVDRVIDVFPIYGTKIIQKFSRYEEEQRRVSFACEGLSDLLGPWDRDGIIAENVLKFLGDDIDALIEHRIDMTAKNILKCITDN